MGLAERIDGITDLVRERADEVEARRRIPDDVLAAIRGTGLNRAFVPRDLGGSELAVGEVVDGIERIAAADGSTGWCASIGAVSNVFAGYLAPEVGKEVFADTDAPSAGMFGAFGRATPAGDAYRFSGRWPFASNCLHSTWIGLGSFFLDADGEQEPVPRLVMVPMAEAVVEDTWDAPGLCGTGSHHLSVTDAIVTRDRSLAFVDPPRFDGPLWTMPLFSAIAPALGIVPLGIARGAVDAVAQLIRGRAGSTRGSLADDQVALADFAMADTRLRAARAGLEAAVDAAWRAAERGERADAVLQGRVQAAVSHGCEVAVDVTSTCHRLGGGAAAYAGSRLLRALRDVETARQHIMFGFGSRPVYGQAIAGLPTFAPPMIT